MKKRYADHKIIWIKLGVFILLVFMIQLFAQHSESIEHNYSLFVYPGMAKFLRILFGWIPFSIGDVFYIVLLCIFLGKLIHFIKMMAKRQLTWSFFGHKILRFMVGVLCIYVIFYAFWGLNYYRKGIASQLHIERKSYNTQELLELTQLLAVRASDYRKKMEEKDFNVDKKQLFQMAKDSYDSAQRYYPFLKFNYKSTKSSLFGALGNYLGYTGYYNPFSGEAQINMHTPLMVLPAVVCHEMAHQLGYATEDEANFIGYLAASHAHNNVFLYSTYLDLYQYAAGELFVRDSVQYVIARQSLDTLVKKDIVNIRNFYLPYRSQMHKVINILYGQYLKANNQPQGIDTYSDVVSLLIAYRKKYQNI